MYCYYITSKTPVGFPLPCNIDLGEPVNWKAKAGCSGWWGESWKPGIADSETGSIVSCMYIREYCVPVDKALGKALVRGTYVCKALFR